MLVGRSLGIDQDLNVLPVGLLSRFRRTIECHSKNFRTWAILKDDLIFCFQRQENFAENILVVLRVEILSVASRVTGVAPEQAGMVG